jgi:Ca2+-transporting ATPase
MPVHIVWLELIIHPSALFAFQQPAEGVDGIPRSRKTFFSRADLIALVAIGLLLTVVMCFSFVSGLAENRGEGHARAKSMVMLTFWSAGTVATFSRLKTRASIVIVVCTVITTLALVKITASATNLKLAPLHLRDWAAIMGWIAVFLAFQWIKVNNARVYTKALQNQ